MSKMSGILGVALLVLLLSPGASEALGPEGRPVTRTEAAKEYAKEAARDTTNAAQNVGESMKQTAKAAYETTADSIKSVTGAPTDAAYRDSSGRFVEDIKTRAGDAAGAMRDAVSRGAQTITGGKQDHGSDAPTGAAYRDRAGRYVADSAATTHSRASDAAEAVKDTAARATHTAADTVRAAGEAASGAAAATKDAAVRTAQAAKEKAAQAYDATADTVGSTRDRVWDSPDSEKPYTQRAREMAAQTGEAAKGHASYAGERLSESAQAAADAARRAGQNAREGAARTYDSATDTLGTPVRDRDWGYGREDDRGVMDKAGEYLQGAKDSVKNAAGATGDATRRAGQNVRDGAARTYDSAANTLGTPVKDRDWRENGHGIMDKAGEYYEGAKDAVNHAAGATEDAAMRARDATRDNATRLAKSRRWSKVLRFLHLLTYAVTFGSAVWMTFVSGRILVRSIPREQFRNVQTKMFPYFLKFMVAGESVLALLYSLLNGFSSKWSIALLGLIAVTAYNAFVLEPKTTKIYLERLRMEKEEGRGISAENLQDKQKNFSELHGFSAVLNMLSLAGLTYHGWKMVQTLTA